MLLSTPDFNDIEYEPEKQPGRTGSDDAETCFDICCRLPITTCAVVGVLLVGSAYLLTSQNILFQLAGVVIIVALIGGIYDRYGRKKHSDSINDYGISQT